MSHKQSDSRCLVVYCDPETKDQWVKVSGDIENCTYYNVKWNKSQNPDWFMDFLGCRYNSLLFLGKSSYDICENSPLLSIVKPSLVRYCFEELSSISKEYSVAGLIKERSIQGHEQNTD